MASTAGDRAPRAGALVAARRRLRLQPETRRLAALREPQDVAHLLAAVGGPGPGVAVGLGRAKGAAAKVVSRAPSDSRRERYAVSPEPLDGSGSGAAAGA